MNLIIYFDNKLEDLCVHLLMLNINALEIHVALTGTCKNTERGATPAQIDAIWIAALTFYQTNPIFPSLQ